MYHLQCMPTYSMPLEGFQALESTGALLSAPTQFILEVLLTKPSKDVFLINIICNHHVHQACMCCNIRDLCSVNEY